MQIQFSWRSLHCPSCCSSPPPTKGNNAHWCHSHAKQSIQALVPRLTNLLSPKTQPFLHAEWMCEQQHHLQVPIAEYQGFFEAVLDPLWRWKRKRERLVFFPWYFQGPAISNCLWYPVVCRWWSSLDSEVLFWTSVLRLDPVRSHSVCARPFYRCFNHYSVAFYVTAVLK